MFTRRAGARAAAGSFCQCEHLRLPATSLVRWFSSSHSRPAARRPQAPKLYRLLGIEPSATAREIKQGFLTQARLHHPDVSQEADAADAFDKIQGALTTLFDPATRREYDTSSGCVQPDYVYDNTADSSFDRIPLTAMAEEELEKHGDHLDDRIRIVNESVAALGEGAVVYNAREEELSAELRGLADRRQVHKQSPSHLN